VKTKKMTGKWRIRDIIHLQRRQKSPKSQHLLLHQKEIVDCTDFAWFLLLVAVLFFVVGDFFS
jgi:hypothetical protein